MQAKIAGEDVGLVVRIDRPTYPFDLQQLRNCCGSRPAHLRPLRDLPVDARSEWREEIGGTGGRSERIAIGLVARSLKTIVDGCTGMVTGECDDMCSNAEVSMGPFLSSTVRPAVYLIQVRGGVRGL